MIRTQPSVSALTSLEAALAALLDGLAPVPLRFVPLERAAGRIAAEMPSLVQALPAEDRATTDGWACRSLDLAGASAYSPVPLPAAPDWVEAGDLMPAGCDCVVDAGLVDVSGPMPQVSGEATPGQGVRRTGTDVGAGRPPMIPGARINAADLLAARVLGLQEVAVRSPKVRLIDVAAPSGEIVTASFIADCLKASGAAVNSVETAQRDAGSIGRMLEGRSCDLFVLIGGTGAGRNDPTAEALAARGTLLLHNIAMQPGGTAAVGRLENKPVIALPGAPDQAFAGLLALVQPVVDRLSHRSGRRSMTLPLQRKISSTVGVTELVLMRQEGNAWMPLAVGDFTLDAIRLADGWLAVPGSSEGYAAGTPVAAWLLRECM